MADLTHAPGELFLVGILTCKLCGLSTLVHYEEGDNVGFSLKESAERLAAHITKHHWRELKREPSL